MEGKKTVAGLSPGRSLFLIYNLPVYFRPGKITMAFLYNLLHHLLSIYMNVGKVNSGFIVRFEKELVVRSFPKKCFICMVR